MPCKFNLDKFNEKANEKAVGLAHDIYNWNGGVVVDVNENLEHESQWSWHLC